MHQRSSYPKQFNPQVVRECLLPGATVSSVAIRHGINANVIRFPHNGIGAISTRNPASPPSISSSHCLP
ncbi:transposase [Pseudomonas fluorescens]|uniref:transposase n=1 Tax=Pseudomonas fluorescens TaxID=294 RepID=UPI001784D320